MKRLATNQGQQEQTGLTKEIILMGINEQDQRTIDFQGLHDESVNG